MSSKNQLILIDGNGLMHRAFHAYPTLSTSKGEVVNAVYGFTIMLLQVLDKFKPKYIAVTFDRGTPTFRHQEFTQYKALRKPMDEGLAGQIQRINDMVVAFNIPIFAVDGYEADDLIGTISEKATLMSDVDEVIIVTGDRDLLQLINHKVMTFMPGKTFSEGFLVDEVIFTQKYGLETPKQLIDFKALRGDTSDNIPGVAGIGDVGATKLIKKYGTLENIYLHLSEIEPKTKHKLEESAEMAALSKRLATIDTDSPIQFDLSECETEKYDKEKVVELLKELEFKSLVARVEKTSKDVGGVIDGKKVLVDKDLVLTIEEQKGKIREYLKDQIKEVVDLDIKMIDVLDKMNKNGILVDKDVLELLSVDFGKKLENLTKEIYEDAGHEFNINSPKQLAEVLFDDLKLPVIKRTKTGRSTDEEVLKELSVGGGIAEKILEYRELYKLKSTYIDALPKYIQEDGRIHSKLHLDVAATGRLSSSDPNLQNIPIKSQWGNAIRKAFVAESGYVFVAVDYSQIELRILAHLSGDSAMKEIFEKGSDIHTSTAALIFGVVESDVTKDQRRSAKTINFGLMYGMGANALSRDLKITFSQAQLFIKAYFDAFPNVKKWIDGIIETGEESGYIETIMGRRRYLPELKSLDKRIKAAGVRMAINMPAQGSQAEMIKLAMVSIEKLIADSDSEIRMTLQVHDELVFEVREDVVKKWVDIVTGEMVGALPLSVHVDVGVNIGKSWGEMNRFEELVLIK
ncbi:MAG: DNA polymerase [bacterium]|nr:DNA polymerase [bacterium]